MVIQRSYKIRMFVLICLVILCSVVDLFAETQDANVPEDLFDMSIEELLDIKISVASKKPESTDIAQGVVNVVTRNGIQLYCDRDLYQPMQPQPSVYTENSFAYSDNPASLKLIVMPYQNKASGQRISHSRTGFEIF